MQTDNQEYRVRLVVQDAHRNRLAVLILPASVRPTRSRLQEEIGKHEDLVNTMVANSGGRPANMAISSHQKIDGKWASIG